jgi:hypothetical protein
LEITYCKPGSALTLPFDDFQFQRFRNRPIARAKFDSGGVCLGHNQISWNEFSSVMHVSLHKLNHSRRKYAPRWFFNNAALAEIILQQLSRRLGHWKNPPDPKIPKGERLEKLQQQLAGRVPFLTAELTEHCRQYVEAKRAGCSEEEKKSRELQIQILDSQIATARRMAQILASICFFYVRMGWNSVDVSNEIGNGLSPVAIRQCIRRLKLTAHSMGYTD